MRSRVVEAVRPLTPTFGPIRWVSEGSLHLTLRFLGWASGVALDRLIECVRPAALRSSPEEAHINGLGMFPERGAPRVLWLGVSLGPKLLALQQACDQAAVRSGFTEEDRAFRSHLTLGRWRDRVARPNPPALDLGSVRLDTLVLFRSHLSSRGATYTPLAVFPLGVPPDVMRS